MHQSRLSSFIIDCQGTDTEKAAEFWGKALGRKVTFSDPEQPSYRELAVHEDEPILLVQTVPHPSRIHLDIETDDLDAECQRLEALGAKRIEFVKRWWVMEAPTGQRFCVIKPQRGPLDGKRGINSWDGG